MGVWSNAKGTFESFFRLGGTQGAGIKDAAGEIQMRDSDDSDGAGIEVEYVEFESDATAPVSESGKARVRYNNVELQQSINGGSYEPLSSSTPSHETGQRTRVTFRTCPGSGGVCGPNVNLNEVGSGGGANHYEVDGIYDRRSSGASSGSQATYRYTNSANGLAMVSTEPETWWKVRTGPVITAAAQTVGNIDRSGGGPPTSSGTNTSSHCYLRHDTTAGDSGWVLSTADGTTQEVSATVASIAADTAYLIYIDQRTAGEVTCRIATWAGTGWGAWSAPVTNSTNVPASTDSMRPWATVTTREAVSKQIKVASLELESN